MGLRKYLNQNIEKLKRGFHAEEDFERCIIPNCKKITTIRKNTNIRLREYYVEGAGQLCKQCYEKIYD
jgi:hypothetical protein